METTRQVEMILYNQYYYIGGGSPVWDDFFERFSHLLVEETNANGGYPVERFDKNVVVLFKLFVEEGKRWCQQEHPNCGERDVFAPFRIERVDVNRPFSFHYNDETGTESIMYKDTIPWMMVDENQLSGVTQQPKS